MQRSLVQSLLIGAAARALVPKGVLLSLPGCATGEPLDNHCHLLATRLAQAMPGGKVVSGWALERVKRTPGKVQDLQVVFDYHSVVVDGRGQMVCPSTRAGETIEFLPDPERPFDIESLHCFNLATFANHPLRGELGHAIAPYTLAWMAPFGAGHAYSTDKRHAQWASFGWCDPFAFAAERGLDRDSLLDMCFASDLDQIAEALGPNAMRAGGKVFLAQVRARRDLFRRARPAVAA